MTGFSYRATFAALVATSVFALMAMAQNTSNSGTKQENNQSNQGQASNQQKDQQNQGSNQGTNQQNQANENQRSNNNTNRSDSQQADNRNNRQDNQVQSQADRSDQSNRDRSNRDASSNDRSSSRSADRDDRNSRDSQYRDRNDSRNRSSQYNRDRDSDRDRPDRSREGRDRDSDRRGDMRGPDIGIWFGRSTRDGLVISDVSTKGPIAKFGFHEGDRIVSVDGHRVSSEADFMRYVLHGRDRVTVIVFRDGSEKTIYVEPDVFTQDYETTQVDPLERFGIIVDDRYDDRIVVWRVIPRSPAYYAGFRPGDVIVTFSGHPYRTRTEFERSVGEWKPGEAEVQIRRGDRTRELSVDVPRFDRQDDRTARRNERVDERRNYDRDNNRGGILNGPVLRRGNR